MSQAEPPHNERSHGSHGALPFLVVGALSVAVLLGHALSHLPFISDDAFISLRYSQRLLDGHGLTWTDGPRVEGYTNFLWTLACAGLGAPGVDLVDAARGLGLVCMSLALLAVAWATRARNAADLTPALTATVGLALTGTFAVWAIGGLEQPFVAVFLAWALALTLPMLRPDSRIDWKTWLASLLLGLLCLSRADGPIVCVGIGLGLLAALWFSPKAWRAVTVLAAFPLALTAGHLVFRYVYYGDFVPNSARVKVAFSSQRLSAGAGYVVQGALAYAPLILSAIAACAICLRDRERRPRVIMLSLVAVVWLGYIAFVGGDIFPARRQWLVALIPLALLTAECLARINAQPGGRGLAVVIAGALLMLTAAHQIRPFDPMVAAARWERWEWDGQAVGRLLRRAFADMPDKPLLAVDPAGALPYYARLPALDMLGLNDRHIARHPPPGFGAGWMGHELGDGQYVLDCKPDLIVFEVPAGRERAFFISGKQMQGDEKAGLPPDPRFAEFYRLLQYDAPRPDDSPIKGPPVKALIWTRVEDGRIGIRRSDARVTIPGFLLAEMPPGTRPDGADVPAAARLNKQGQLVSAISLSSVGRLTRLKLGAGGWRCSATVDGPLKVEVRMAGTSRALATGALPLQFGLPADGAVDLLVRSSGRCEVHELTLERGD